MKKEDLCQIGSRLREAREEKHLTQAELAQKVNKAVSYVEMIERGERNVSFETFIDILKVLGVTADSILCDVID